MKNFKKRFLSSVVALAMMLTSFSFTALAEGAEITKIYADSFGIDVLYSATPDASAYASISFVPADDMSDEAAFTPVFDEEYNILHINFDEDIELDKQYVLTIGGLKKLVTVNTYDFLDFESDITTDSKLNERGTVTENTKLGASSQDKSVVLQGERFSFQTSAELIDSTISLKTASYMNSTAEDCWTASDVQIWKTTNLGLGDGGIGVELEASQAVSFVKGRWWDPYEDSKKVYSYNLADGEKAFGWFGELGENGAPTTSYSSYDDIDTVTEPSYEPHVAFRSYASDDTTGNYDTMVTFVADGEERPVYQGTNRADADLFQKVESVGNVSGGKIGNIGRVYVGVISTGAVTTIDDVLVTTCTVADDIEDAQILENGIYADLYGVQIQLDGPVSVAQKNNTFVTDRSGNKVAAAIEFEKDMNILNIHFEEPIKLNTSYKVNINGIEKLFKVKSVMSEDFEGDSFEGVTTVGGEETTVTGKNGVNWLMSAGGTFITESADFNANDDNRKAVVYHGDPRLIRAASSYVKQDRTGKFTYYAQTQLYAGTSSGRYAYMFVGGWTPKSGAVVLSMDNMSMQLSRTTGAPAITGWPTYDFTSGEALTYGKRAGNGATNSIVGTITGFTEATGEYTSATPATPVNHAMRIVGRNYSAYADMGNGPQFTGTLYDAVEKSLATNSIGVATSQNTAFLVVDDIFVTQCEITDYDPSNVEIIEVTDIYADKKAIYVEFDKDAFEAEDNFTGIIVKNNGRESDFTATVEDNVVIITPEGGVESNAMYTVTVPDKFAPSAFATTDKSYAETFKLTVYAEEDFAGDKLNSENVAATNAMFKDGKLVLRNGTLSIPSVATAKDYVVEFDATVYSSVLDRAIEAEMVTEGASAHMDYEEAVPNLYVNYNANQAGFGSYRWLVQKDTVSRQYVSRDGVDSELDSTASAISFGDAINNIWGFDNTAEGLNFYKKGDDLINVTMFATQYSTHEPVEYSVKFDKAGKAASYYLDGALVSAFAGDENDNVAETGEFSVVVSDSEYVVFDNVVAYSYEEFEDIAVTLEGTSITVENITSEEKPVVIVVAAYNNDNMMLDAWVSEYTSVDGNDAVEDTVVFTNASGATKYKAFVWDNMSSLIPYCVPAQYTLPTTVQ